jgi:hypothetical protein
MEYYPTIKLKITSPAGKWMEQDMTQKDVFSYSNNRLKKTKGHET